jgi:hypothetical protein
VLRLALELAIAPAFVGTSTLACRRWGERIGGLFSAFPAVVGPLLLIAAQTRGAGFAAQTAAGTLLGLLGLAVFVLVYAWVATRAGWGLSLLAGWSCAMVSAAFVEVFGGHAALAVGLLGASVALATVRRAPPSPADDAAAIFGPSLAFRRELGLRMAVTAALVAALAVAAQLLGPLIGGMLAGLPVLLSVLAVFTHRRDGVVALVALLRGMLTGMAAFIAFCTVVALLIVPAGTAVAFVAATLAAVGLQAIALTGGGRPARADSLLVRRGT